MTKKINQYTHKSIQIIFAKKLIDKILDGKYYRVSNENSLKDYSQKAAKIPYFECENILGQNLIGIKYEQLWKDSPKPLKNSKNAFRVISADFVTFDEGTGIVHTAPSFGSDDAIAARSVESETMEAGINISANLGMMVPYINVSYATEDTTQASYKTEAGTDGSALDIAASNYSESYTIGGGINFMIGSNISGGVRAGMINGREDWSESYIWRNFVSKKIVYGTAKK